jgi:DNA-binding CsgD family transcriptional regulator
MKSGNLCAAKSGRRALMKKRPSGSGTLSAARGLAGGRRCGTAGVAARAAALKLEQLTARELEVLALIADGCTDRGIASELYITPKTVEAHVRSIFRTLDLPTRRRADATPRSCSDARERRKAPNVRRRRPPSVLLSGSEAMWPPGSGQAASACSVVRAGSWKSSPRFAA